MYHVSHIKPTARATYHHIDSTSLTNTLLICQVVGFMSLSPYTSIRRLQMKLRFFRPGNIFYSHQQSNLCMSWWAQAMRKSLCCAITNGARVGQQLGNFILMTVRWKVCTLTLGDTAAFKYAAIWKCVSCLSCLRIYEGRRSPVLSKSLADRTAVGDFMFCRILDTHRTLVICFCLKI